jgi:cephalosporin-C deacetylase-like acetyl esterase
MYSMGIDGYLFIKRHPHEIEILVILKVRKDITFAIDHQMNIPESVNLIDTVVSEKTTYCIVNKLRRPRRMTPI